MTREEFDTEMEEFSRLLRDPDDGGISITVYALDDTPGKDPRSRRDMVKIAEATKGTIPDPYLLTYEELCTLGQIAKKDLYEALGTAFYYGYELARREAKNRKKKKKGAHRKNQ